MDDLEGPNNVTMDGIGKEIEVHLGEAFGFILASMKRSNFIPMFEKKKKSHVKLKNGNSNIDRVVFF